MTASVKVDVHGSCVSRSCFEMIDKTLVEVSNTFSRNHIVSCMMPPANIPFSHGDLQQYSSEHSERCMRRALDKSTLPLLLQSEADYIVIDFFDLCQPVAAYNDTTFSTYDYTFYNSPFYKANAQKFSVVDFFNLPVFLWYGYVDTYFQKISEKFHDRIILNRLNCSTVFMSKNHRIYDIPERLCSFGNAKYNTALYDLENYIIDKYQPYVIDISKYFIPDEADNPDTTPVHYENLYTVTQSSIMKRILTDTENRTRYFDALPPLTTAALLERPVSDKDFLRIYKERELPFSCDSLLDYVFQMWEAEEIAKNRVWIARLYRKYDSALKNIPSDSTLLQPLLSDHDLWSDMSNSSSSLRQSVFQYLHDTDLLLHMPVADLYRRFLSAFESGQLSKWILELNALSILAPDYQDVPRYLSQFYEAAGDDYSIRKLALESRLGK